MSSIPFVGLHRHSSASFLDGYGLPEQIVARLQDLGQTACAITDHGSTWGHLGFAQAMQKAGLSAILGVEFYHVPDRAKHAEGRGSGRKVKNPEGDYDIAHLTVLAKNQVGYRNLLALTKLSYEAGFYRKPTIDWNDIFRHQEGLIVLTGCVGGQLSSCLYPTEGEHGFELDRGRDLVRDWLEYLRGQIEHLYVEITPCPGLQISVQACRELWAAAKELNLPLVLTDDAHFPCPEDHAAEDAMVAIQTRRKVHDPERKLKLPAYHYHCSGEEIVERARLVLPGIPEGDLKVAAARSVEIAKGCAVEIPRPKGPLFTVPGGLTSDELLLNWIEEGKSYRRDLGLLPQIGTAEWQKYEERLDYEMGIIAHHRFSDYFLMVTDIARWAKSQGYWCIARGSCGGSLVCWYLGLCQIDPVELRLPVERFIDRTRPDLPDIDLDVDSRYRDRIFRYLEEKYGKEHCAQIAALSTFRSKQAINDICKVYDIPSQVGRQLIQLMPEVDAEEGIKSRGRLNHLFQSNEQAQQLLKQYPALKVAGQIESQCRQATIHAAGFVVDQIPLSEIVGIITQKDGTRLMACDMQQAAKQGFLKIDCLSVEMLATVSETLAQIGKNHEWLYQLPRDDKATYEMLSAGRNYGVFQMKGSTAGKLLVQMQPTKFSDLVALGALARPGPLQSGGAQEYIERKHGRQPMPHYHSLIMDIVSETYGVILYQEQVMRIMREVGGMDWPAVHAIRKLVSKSGGAVAMEQYKPAYLQSAREKGVPEREAEPLWLQCQRAGNYSFNQCVSGDTVVCRPNNIKGGPITVSELFIAQESRTDWGAKIRSGNLHLLQMGADRRVRPGPMKAVYYQGKRPVFKVVTENGHEIKVTSNHRLLTSDGYRLVSDLGQGDRLIVAGQKEAKEPRGCQTERARGKNYSHIGFPEGDANPAWIDGRTDLFETAKRQVRDRANGNCEICGKKETGRFELAHLISLHVFEWNYEKYHSSENLRWLCNSCHKKLDYQTGVRKKRYSKGLPVEESIITSITACGEEDVYDIEMDTPEHNFVANGIISHNSHSAAYALIGYWSAYLKCHYPAVFCCACANHEKKEQYQREILREFKQMGGSLELLDYNRSKSEFTTPEPNLILGGFQTIKGMGRETAEKLVAGQPYRSWTQFLLKCPSSTAKDLQAVGVHQHTIDLDMALVVAPWYAEVEYLEVEQEAFERMNCHRISDVLQAMESGRQMPVIRLLGRVTNADQSVGKHASHSESQERCVLTVADPTGSLDVWFSPWKWTEVKRAWNPLQGETEGIGNSVYVVAGFSHDRTRVFGEKAVLLRQSKAKVDPKTRKLIRDEKKREVRHGVMELEV